MTRLLRIVASVFLGLVLLEGGLRVAGFVYMRAQSRGGGAAAARRILCLGDSHTFGIWLAKDDAYPARLEALLRQASPTAAWGVLNAGVPGYATGDVLDRLERQVHNGRYDAVVVMAGANDRWKGAERASGRPWYENVKVVKLAFLLFRREPPPRVTDVDAVVHPDDVAGRPSEGKPDTATVSLLDRSGVPIRFEQRTTGELESNAELEAKLSRNYAEIARMASAAKVQLLFLAYPNGENDLGLANRLMGAAARAAGVPYVDLSSTMAEAGKRFQFEELYFSDRHPTALTCELAARVLHAELLARGIAEGRPVPDLWSGLPVAPMRSSPIEFAVEGPGEITVCVKTDSGRRVHFFLSWSPGETDVLGHRIPVGRDALFERTVDPANPTLTQAVAGSDGVARVRLTRILGAEAVSGRTLHAAAAILGKDGAPGLHDITPPKEFRIP